jgi:hypothetical protein
MNQSTTPVKVPKNVFEGLEFVRKEGLTNMFDINSVQRFAHQYDYYETVVWLDNPDNRKIYRDGMFRGFEPSESAETNATA